MIKNKFKKLLLLSSILILAQNAYSAEYRLSLKIDNKILNVIEVPKSTTVEAGINCSNNSCTFNSTTGTGNVTSWNWDFGDGNQSTDQNASEF